MTTALVLMLVATTLAGDPSMPAPATIVVATHDSSDRSKQAADFVGDGRDDQQQINDAIAALPPAGGTVLLMEGTYDIRRVGDAMGGVLINRSDVVLAGQGSSTRLILAPDQNINVVRIIGSGVSRVTVRDLYVDANRQHNDKPWGSPDISHERFEVCGIKGWYRAPRDAPQGEPIREITVRNCHIVNAQRLGIMLHGEHVRVYDNIIGNAGSDAVELLGGPGEIRGNTFIITGQTHVAVGSDAADDIRMVDNTVHVTASGRLDIAFRSWAASQRHVLTGNQLHIEAGGVCTLAMDLRGTMATVTGNSIYAADAEQPTRLKIGGGSTVVTANLLENVVIEVNDETGSNEPIIVRNNILKNSRIEKIAGDLLTDVAP